MQISAFVPRKHFMIWGFVLVFYFILNFTLSVAKPIWQNWQYSSLPCVRYLTPLPSQLLPSQSHPVHSDSVEDSLHL